MQAFNKYYAPDYDPSSADRGNLNRIAGRSTVKKRSIRIGADDAGVAENDDVDGAAKSIQTVEGQVVRFALPFSIGCTICEARMAQGTRFNAVKARCGDYLGNPVFEFAIKCYTCTNEMHIRTDPQHATYVLVSGATGGRSAAAQPDGSILPAVVGARVDDPLAGLEREVRQKRKIRDERDHVAQLIEENERQWSDHYERSQRLRRTFRRDKRIERDKQSRRATVEDRLGLPREALLENVECDRAEARAVQFVGGASRRSLRNRYDARSGSIFERSKP